MKFQHNVNKSQEIIQSGNKQETNTVVISSVNKATQMEVSFISHQQLLNNIWFILCHHLKPCFVIGWFHSSTICNLYGKNLRL